jgi:predicted N-acetyltransferase YhbS
VKATFSSQTLTSAHSCEAFTCGRPELDEWLREAGLHAQSMRTARTFVWTRGDELAVVAAYFSLAAHVVRRTEAPARVGRGSPNEIPAILLARLALADELQGRGLGEELLWDALSRCVRASDTAGARLVVVDAIDTRAAEFYARYGFRALPARPLRLFQKVSDLAAALGS